MRHTLDHLRSQTYPWWQLRIHAQAETIGKIQAEVDHDPRVRTLHLDESSTDGYSEDLGGHADILVPK